MMDLGDGYPLAILYLLLPRLEYFFRKINSMGQRSSRNLIIFEYLIKKWPVPHTKGLTFPVQN